MADVVDKIGVVRDHRWIKAGEQRKRLEVAGCRVVVDLDGKQKGVTQADLIRMSTGGRTFALAHAFLLADPKSRRQRGGLKANFDAMLVAIGKRGGIVEDLETGLTTANKAHCKAIKAVAYSNMARSNQGLRSALNGTKSRGRPAVRFSPDQLKDARAVWRNVKDYPTWQEAEAAFPEGFTAARAFRLWRGRY